MEVYDESADGRPFTDFVPLCEEHVYVDPKTFHIDEKISLGDVECSVHLMDSRRRF